MKINWQNLGVAIEKGKAAFEGSDFGTPADLGGTSFYDHPMSDLAGAAALEDQLRSTDFVIGTSKWGGSDLVTE
jgi:hypothetical protein